MNPPISIKTFNPWPYALLGFFVLFISLIVFFIVFAVGQDMELVQPDYYEKEMSYQQQIDRENRTRSVRDEVAITYDPQGRAVGIRLPLEHVRKKLTGSIQFYRPSDSRLDHEVALDPGLDGRQRVTVAALTAGLWNLRMLWQVDGVEYFTKRTVIIAAR